MTDGAVDVDVDALAKRHSPIVVTHPHESSLMCTSEYFLANSALFDRLRGEVVKDVATNELLNQYDNRRYCTRPNSNALRGQGAAPSYYSHYIKDGVLFIQYVFLYTDNPGYVRCGVALGRHLSDVEHVTMQFTENNEVSRVYFAAHSSKQGQWHSSRECAWRGDRLIVYSALGSHASYAHTGTYIRILGLVNDVCRHGEENDEEAVPLPDEAWTWWQGKLAPTGVTPPRRQGWFNHENGQSISWWKRCIGCCWW
ncbi:MAG: hypothetical protein CMK92_02395 [Pseudomonas sp.]|nr:hypothetical protein [Pseudomonas sp.]